ncbi:hypothetical protein HV331_25180 (plasmid) [Klebsiella aerogenes]|uniref:Uncharacterized protein n=1 Tax=Klebsiella aerogenes TaxID=548 RepID=A0AAP9R1F8_KLEAE|nr:hypothetical protein HV331_25180 [Klebsiella aerogenes]
MFYDARRPVESSVSEEVPGYEDSAEQEGNDPRDFFGEMEITVRLMIIGGELREAQPWLDADITLADLATFDREGYEAQYITLINQSTTSVSVTSIWSGPLSVLPMSRTSSPSTRCGPVFEDVA